MPTANCCMMQPGSPDSLAPRVIRRRDTSRPLFVSSQHGGPSSPCLSTSTTVSHLSKQEDIAELQAIFEAKQVPPKDEYRPKSKKSSTSLTSVKERLKKHLSRELKVQKRRSRSSVGTSEEEVERRAELRRIRQKRIQEELSSDFNYDSDAKSLPAIPGVDSDDAGNPTPFARKNQFLALRPSNRLAAARSSPCLTSPYTKARALQLEARFSELSPRYPTPLRHLGPRSEDIQSDLSNIANTPGTLDLRRYSSSQPASLPLDDEQHVETAELPGPVPAAPALKPQLLPSNVSRSSCWRLSFASENRGAQLRSLSQDKTTQPEADTIAPPLSQLLHSHGLRSTSQAITWSEDSSNKVPSASHSRVSSINHVDDGGWGSDSSQSRGRSRLRRQHTGAPRYRPQSQREIDEVLNRRPGYRPRRVANVSARLLAESYDGAMEIRDRRRRSPSPLAPVAVDRETYHEGGVGKDASRLTDKKIWIPAEYPGIDSRNVGISDTNESETTQQKNDSELKSPEFIRPHNKSRPVIPINSVEDVDHWLHIWREELTGASQRAKANDKSAIGDSVHDLRHYGSWSQFRSHDYNNKARSAGVDDYFGGAAPAVKVEETMQYPSRRPTHNHHNENDHHGSHKKLFTKLLFKEWEKRLQDRLYSSNSTRPDYSFLDTKPETNKKQNPIPGIKLESLQPLFATKRTAVPNGRHEDGASPGSIELDIMTPTRGIAERTEARKSRMKHEKDDAIDLETSISVNDVGKKLTCDTDSPTGNRSNCRIEDIAPVRSGDNAKLLDIALDNARFYDDCLISFGPDEMQGADTKGETAPAAYSGKRYFLTPSPGGSESSDNCTQTNMTVEGRSSFECLRNSTNDFHMELKKMEALERERALRSVKDAFRILT